MFQNILYMEYLSDSMWPVKSSTSLTSILSTPSLNIITASLQEWKNIPIIAVGWEPTTILEMVHGVNSLWFQLMKMVCGRFAWFVCFWGKKKQSIQRNQWTEIAQSVAWENSRHLATPSLSFPTKWRMRKERRNSSLMTCHYSDLGSASDCIVEENF